MNTHVIVLLAHSLRALVEEVSVPRGGSCQAGWELCHTRHRAHACRTVFKTQGGNSYSYDQITEYQQRACETVLASEESRTKTIDTASVAHTSSVLASDKENLLFDRHLVNKRVSSVEGVAPSSASGISCAAQAKSVATNNVPSWRQA